MELKYIDSYGEIVLESKFNPMDFNSSKTSQIGVQE